MMGFQNVGDAFIEPRHPTVSPRTLEKHQAMVDAKGRASPISEFLAIVGI